jgi:hypothetical protein
MNATLGSQVYSISSSPHAVNFQYSVSFASISCKPPAPREKGKQQEVSKVIILLVVFKYNLYN